MAQCLGPLAGEGGRGRTFESCRAHGLFKPFFKARNAEKCTIRPSYSASAPAGEGESRAQREREAKAYWDSLTEAQEVWALSEDGVLQDRAVGLIEAPSSPSSLRWVSWARANPECA